MKDKPTTFLETLRYGAEAALFMAFIGLFRVLGPDRASYLGGWIGRNILCHLPPDRVARANLAAAFPEKTQAERDAIRMAMWDNLGRVVGEYAHLDAFSITGPNPRIRVIDRAQSVAALADGKGVIFVSGHLANWEMMPITGNLLGFDGATVVRPPNNPFVAHYLEVQRGLLGPKDQIAKHNAMRRMIAQLRAGKALYMLADQKLNEGVPVPFFGRDAMTTPAPAALALKLGARIVFASNRRTHGARFEVVLYPGPDFTPTGEETKDMLALTAAITARIEEMVRADPAQWLWIHNRWPKDGRPPRDSAAALT
ncbi:MAG: lysophospholipid acyltransferase family protein [Alphaproteobacteria bacterium]|nr:lysophospholipid acyltransferase family protein [Alphaproteobacteria bacterium]